MITPTLARAGLRWLLEVDHVGQVYRWTSDGASVSSDDGDLATTGGLDAITIVESLPVAGGVADRRSVSVALQWPTNAAEEAQRGLDMSAGTGTLYLLAEGQQRESARVVVSGPMSEPVYGGPGEPVRFTVGGEPTDDAAQIPGADERVSLSTWPSAPEASLGSWYPIVWGRPGVADDAGTIEGSPAILLADTAGAADTLLIAGHLVTATTVQVVWDDAGSLTAETATVAISTDNLGLRVSTVDVSGLSAGLRAAGAWTIRWNGGGAMRSPYKVGTLNTLGEIGRWLAERSTVPQDRAAWAAVAQRFPWSSAGWVSEPASPQEILRDQILPALPVSLSWGRRGMRPIRYAYDATPAEVVEHLIAGEDCSRVEGVTYERQPHELTQEVRVGYGGDSARRWVVVRADGIGDSAEDTSSVWTRAARQRWRTGDVRTREVLSPAIWRRSTAVQVGLWQARIFGASPRLVDYDCGPERAWIDVGDVVWLTDTELTEAKTLAIVVGRRVGISATVRLTLMVLPGWDTRQRGKPSGSSNDTPSYPVG